MLIKINCSQCGKEIRIDVAKVERLEKELAQAKSDMDYYRAKLAALEVKNENNPFASLFG